MGARRRIILGSGVLAVVLALVGVLVVTNNGSDRPSAQPTRGSPTTAARSDGAESSVNSQPATSPSSAVTAVPAESLVATIRPEGAPGSQTAGGPPTLKVPGGWLGAASVLPVIGQRPGWVEVRLAQRPNGSIAWVPASDVSLATDSYHIVINLGTMHLQLFNHGQEVANFPAGVGIPRRSHTDRSLFRGLVRSGTITRLRRLRDGHIRPQQHHQRLGGVRRRHSRHSRILGIRRSYRHHGGASVPRLRSPSRRRSCSTSRSASRHPHRHHGLTVEACRTDRGARLLSSRDEDNTPFCGEESRSTQRVIDPHIVQESRYSFQT